MDTGTKTNYFRRAVGTIICIAPIALFTASIFHGLTHGGVTGLTGMVFIALGAIVAAFNCYLSFVRPILYRRKEGSIEGYKHVSGFPGIGTLLVIAGGIIGFGSIPVAMVGLIATMLDTGGSLWFLIATWRDSSLWDL